MSNRIGPCLTDAQIESLHARELPADLHEQALRHLEHCADCRRRDAQLAAACDKFLAGVRDAVRQAGPADPAAIWGQTQRGVPIPPAATCPSPPRSGDIAGGS